MGDAVNTNPFPVYVQSTSFFLVGLIHCGSDFPPLMRAIPVLDYLLNWITRRSDKIRFQVRA